MSFQLKFSIEEFLNSNGYLVSPQDAQLLFFRLDNNKDKILDYDEFKEVFMWRNSGMATHTSKFSNSIISHHIGNNGNISNTYNDQDLEIKLSKSKPFYPSNNQTQSENNKMTNESFYNKNSIHHNEVNNFKKTGLSGLSALSEHRKYKNENTNLENNNISGLPISQFQKDPFLEDQNYNFQYRLDKQSNLITSGKSGNYDKKFENQVNPISNTNSMFTKSIKQDAVNSEYQIKTNNIEDSKYNTYNSFPYKTSNLYNSNKERFKDYI